MTSAIDQFLKKPCGGVGVYCSRGAVIDEDDCGKYVVWDGAARGVHMDGSLAGNGNGMMTNV